MSLPELSTDILEGINLTASTSLPEGEKKEAENELGEVVGGGTEERECMYVYVCACVDREVMVDIYYNTLRSSALLLTCYMHHTTLHPLHTITLPHHRHRI